MALENIVIVDITLNTTAVSRQGFGTPIFVSAHSYFPARSRGYTSLTSAKEDIPEDSPTYKHYKVSFLNNHLSHLFTLGVEMLMKH